MNVQQDDNGKKGSFYIADNSERVAEMFYIYSGEDKIIIDHTVVSEAYEGRGLGKQLVKACVEWARAKNIHIIPLCPFAKGVFERMPEYRDVLV